MSRSRWNTCCKHRDAAGAAAHRLPVHHHRGGIARRRRAREARQRPHARGFSGGAAPARAPRTCRFRRRSSRSRRGPRSPATRFLRDLATGSGGAVAPIQLAIRLLIPAGSRLLELPEVRNGGTVRRRGALLSVEELPTRAWMRCGAAQRACAAARRKASRRKSSARSRGCADAGEWPSRRAVARDDSVSDRALVLLSGAWRRAVGSCIDQRKS